MPIKFEDNYNLLYVFTTTLYFLLLNLVFEFENILNSFDSILKLSFICHFKDSVVHGFIMSRSDL